VLKSLLLSAEGWILRRHLFSLKRCETSRSGTHGATLELLALSHRIASRLKRFLCKDASGRSRRDSSFPLIQQNSLQLAWH